MSMRMTLDLLHEFANTEVFCLFHNCMWQSRHSEVNVSFLALCEQTDGFVHFQRVSPLLHDLRLRFRLRLCLDLSFQQTLAHNWKTGLPVLSLVLSQPSKARFRFPEHSNRIVALTNRSPCSNNWLLGGWVGWLSSACRATSEPNSFIQSFPKEIFGGGRGDA